MLNDNVKSFLGNTLRFVLGGLLALGTIAAIIYLPHNILVFIVSIGFIGVIFDILISQSKRIAELEELTITLEYKVRRLENTRNESETP